MKNNQNIDMMEERRFKTSAKCAGCVSAIGEQLGKVMQPEQWSVDLSSPDKILTVRSADVSDGRIVELVNAAGFKIEKI